MSPPRLQIKPDITPTLYDINKSFDVIKTSRYNGIKGEEYTRMSLFTSFVLGRKPVILTGSRGSGKTVEENTLIKTKDSFKPIKDIKEGDIIQSFNEIDRKMEFSKVSYKTDRYQKECYKLTLKNGMEVIAAGSHPFYDGINWRCLNELKPNDFICVSNIYLETGYPSDKNEMLILGALISEGGCTGYQVTFTNSNDEFIGLVKQSWIKLRNKIGFEYERSKGNHTFNLKNGVSFLRKFGLEHTSSYTKFIPPIIFESDLESKKVFIQSLFEGDGYIGNHGIEYTSVSKILIQDIQRLLIYLGIRSYFREKKFKLSYGNKREYTAYILYVSGKNLSIFNERIGYLTKKSRERLNKECNKIKRCNQTNVDVIPLSFYNKYPKNIFGIYDQTNLGRYKYNQRKERLIKIKKEFDQKGYINGCSKKINQEYQKFFYSKDYNDFLDIYSDDLFWEQIKSVECIGLQWCYDIEVEKTHNYIANNIIAHNSNCVEIVSQYCARPIDISTSSEKAQIRDMNLNLATHFIVTELNKVSDSFIEVMKDLGEGKSSEYKVLNEMKKPVIFRIDVKPFVTCLADENDAILGEELVSRMITIQTDSTVKQNEFVIADKLLRASTTQNRFGANQDLIKKYISYVKWLPSIDEFTFCYLPGLSIKNAIPPFFTDSRRDTDKYLANTYGISVFHLEDRMVIEKDGKKVMLITPQDAWYNHRIFHPILKQSSLKCNHVQSIILEILKKYASYNPGRPFMYVKEVHASLRKNDLTYGVDTVKKFLDDLYKNGYILRNDETKSHTYEIIDSFKAWNDEIDWKKVVAECVKNIKEEFPEKADEYIERYCKSPQLVIDPFTGDKIDMMGEWKKQTAEVIEVKKVGISDLMDKLEVKQDIKQEPVKVNLVLPKEETDERPIMIEESIVNDNPNMKYDMFFRMNMNPEGIVDMDTFETKFGGQTTQQLINNGYMFKQGIGYKQLK